MRARKIIVRCPHCGRNSELWGCFSSVCTQEFTCGFCENKFKTKIKNRY